MWTTEKTRVAGWQNLNSPQKGTSEINDRKTSRRQGDGEDGDQAWIFQVGTGDNRFDPTHLMVIQFGGFGMFWFGSYHCMVDSWFNTTRKLLKSRRL